MTERYPMLPPAADVLDSFSLQLAIGQRERECRISESRKPAEGLSRRLVLAGVASAAALPLAAAVPPMAETTADPIYAVIERHRKACREHSEAVDTHMDFEESGMEGEKLEEYKRLVAETDASYDRLDEVGCDLINTKPTTLAGILALCRYIKPLFAEDDAPDLPEYISYDDDTTATPAEALCYVIGRAVEDLMKTPAGKAVRA
jgi:hypothetical protein